MELSDKKRFECSVSFTYNAEHPAAAAQEFIGNIAGNPIWFVAVKEVGSVNSYTVDTETNEIECWSGEECEELEVYLLQDDIDRLPPEIAEVGFTNFNANGKSYGCGIYSLKDRELIERIYAPSEEAAEDQARHRALKSGFVVMEPDEIPD